MQAVRLAGVVATAALAGFLCGRMKPPAPLQRRRRLSAHAALWPEILKAMERLPELARQRRAAYETARPFPHFYEDGVFPERLLRAVAAELPTKVEGRGCVPGATACFWRKDTEKSKSVIDVEARMKPATRLLVAAMKSSAFLRFLEALTGIAALIPDPQFRGSGLHFVGPGGRLAVHADFARYEQYGGATAGALQRRVNVFVFFNDDWPEAYGGHLELWARNLSSCEQRILPSFGRLVVFSSTDFSYHGHPQPLAAPADRARRSLALYYYTVGRPSEECLSGDCDQKKGTLFKEPRGCARCEETACRAYG